MYITYLNGLTTTNIHFTTSIAITLSNLVLSCMHTKKEFGRNKESFIVLNLIRKRFIISEHTLLESCTAVFVRWSVDTAEV